MGGRDGFRSSRERMVVPLELVGWRVYGMVGCLVGQVMAVAVALGVVQKILLAMLFSDVRVEKKVIVFLASSIMY